MAKKKVKNKQPSKRWTKYSLSGNKAERKRNCPRCGDGYFLGDHKDRFYCGNCHYMEVKKK